MLILNVKAFFVTVNPRFREARGEIQGCYLF